MAERTKRRHHNKGDQRPGKGIEARRASAIARQTARNNLTNNQQIARLNSRLGNNVGANRERARLTSGD